MNPATPTSKFISTKTTMLARSSFGLIIPEFAAPIERTMTAGRFSVLVRIHKRLVVKFRGSRVNRGVLTENGNFPMVFSRKSTKNATGVSETRQKKNTSVFKI